MRRKGRTFFTALAIAVSVSMAILLVSVGVGLKLGTALMYEDDVDYWIIPKDSSVTDIVSNSEKTMLGGVHASIDTIISFPDIRGATPVLNRLLYASSPGESPKVIMGIGIIPGALDALPANVPGLTPGDSYFNGGPMSGEVVINDKTASVLGSKQGDMLSLGTSSSRLNNSFRVAGEIVAAEYSITPIAVMHLSELQDITGNLKEDRANYMIAKGNNALPLLKALFPDSLVLSSDEYTTYNIVSDKKVMATAIAVSIVSIFIAALFISSTMVLSINEKQKEFALMQAIGVSQRSITKIALYESFIISVFGGFFGILLSYLGQKVLNTAAYNFFEVGQVSVIDPVLWLGGFAIALTAGVFSGLIPVILTRHIDIAGTLG